MVTTPTVVVPIEGARLYSVSGMVLATFMGTPLASGWLMARNYRALGDNANAGQCLIYATVATVAILALTFLLPESIPAFAFSLPQLLVVGYIAKRLQGDRIEAYRTQDRLYSNWRAFGIGILSLIGLLLVVIPTAIAMAMFDLI